MATKTWVGGVDGDWGTALNWSPSGVPASTDDVFIVSGSVDIDDYDGSAVTLGRLVVGSRYTGTIGTSGDKLQINATSLDYSGNGDTAYFEGTFTTLTIQDTSTNDAALNLYGDSSTIHTLRVLGGKGTINIDSSCNITAIIEQVGANAVTLNIADNTTIGGSATLTMDSGTVELNQAVPTITVFGGTLEVALDDGDITTFEQFGGRVKWKPSGDCTITTLTLYAGLFDCRESISPTYTITNTTVHESAILDERSGINNAIFTNPISVESGEIKFDAGRSVAI